LTQIVQSGVKRLDIGGKLLTKLLSQAISMRQVKMNEYYLTVEQIKEEMCYVTQNFKSEISKKVPDVEYYALPDPDIKRKG
jgi:actin-related protein 6